MLYMTTLIHDWSLRIPRIIRRVRIVPGVATAFLVLALAAAQSPARAQTDDSEITTVKSECRTRWMAGKVLVLCHIYCDAMGCDCESLRCPEDAPMVSQTACDRQGDDIRNPLDDTPFPECKDNN
jgi:hypothetical protein